MLHKLFLFYKWYTISWIPTINQHGEGGLVEAGRRTKGIWEGEEGVGMAPGYKTKALGEAERWRKTLWNKTHIFPITLLLSPKQVQPLFWYHPLQQAHPASSSLCPSWKSSDRSLDLPLPIGPVYLQELTLPSTLEKASWSEGNLSPLPDTGSKVSMWSNLGLWDLIWSYK